jgi:small Trp-rich protein
MWLIWTGVALIALKMFEISVFAELSWWWVVLPLGLALLWFELVERRLGWDKKKAFDEIDKVKKDRIKKGLETDKSRRGGRRRA